MTDQREREIREDLEDSDSWLGSKSARADVDHLLFLLDRERERVDMAEKVVEGTLHHLATRREQIAELLEALEEHRCPHCEGLYRDGSRVEGCANKGHRAIAKHKERV